MFRCTIVESLNVLEHILAGLVPRMIGFARNALGLEREKMLPIAVVPEVAPPARRAKHAERLLASLDRSDSLDHSMSIGVGMEPSQPVRSVTHDSIDHHQSPRRMQYLENKLHLHGIAILLR